MDFTALSFVVPFLGYDIVTKQKIVHILGLIGPN